MIESIEMSNIACLCSVYALLYIHMAYFHTLAYVFWFRHFNKKDEIEKE